MELPRSNTIHFCRYDADSIRTGMVRTLKDIFEFVLYWILIGTVTILFVFFIIGLAIVDLLMEMFNKITRSKNND